MQALGRDKGATANSDRFQAISRYMRVKRASAQASDLAGFSDGISDLSWFAGLSFHYALLHLVLAACQR